jgi:hypothetical protein
MYLSTIDKPKTANWKGLSGNVFALGTVSLITDVSSEMVAAILPLYLVIGLQLSPAAYGLIDGVYTGATTLLRLAGGYLADRTNRRKAVAGFGYGLSAVAKLGLLAAGNSLTALGFVITADRAGKGLRTAPRDVVVEVEVCVGDGERRIDAVQARVAQRAGPEQVDDRGRTMRVSRPERQAGDRPDVLLELRRRRALDRPVAAVVDPRRELIDHQRAVAKQEQLNRERADEVHGRSEVQPDGGGLATDGRGQVSGRHGLDEDAAVVEVARGRKDRGLPVESARDDHRQFHVEIQFPLGEQERPHGPAQAAHRRRDI